MGILSVWLHPLRAARALAEVEELRRQCQQSELATQTCSRENEALKADIEKIRGELDNALRSLELYKHRIAALEKEIAQLSEKNKELQTTLSAERAETDEALAEISQKIAQVDAMRQAYEHRISHLRHALSDARLLLSARADYDDLAQVSVIDMNPQPTAAPEAASAATAPAAHTAATAPTAAAASTADINKPLKDSGPSDWLMPLPDKEEV